MTPGDVCRHLDAACGPDRNDRRTFVLFVGTRIFPNGLLRFQGPRCVWTLAKSRAGEKLFSNALVGIGRLVPGPSEEVAQLDIQAAETPPFSSILGLP